MTILRHSPKTKAQAMVEFAIALPILLLLLYGIIEVGRFLFLYSTIVTASRQAVRYGSATGEGTVPGFPHYQDCNGIRNAASRVGYLGPFDTITIQWDLGPNDSNPNHPVTFCAGSTDNSFSPTDNNHRILVTVQKQFTPLVKLVPLSPRNLSATSARTIIVGVPIEVDAPPGNPPVQDPTEIFITSDAPDPSEVNHPVTIWVEVSDSVNANNIPAGIVEVFDVADPANKCVITLTVADNGIGSCPLTFTTTGAKTIAAKFTPTDDVHLSSDTAEAHMVAIADTVTTITLDSPDPSTPNQVINVQVSVVGGSTTPTGTVSISAGGNINCTITLTNGAGGCTITFNNTGIKTITANYNGDSGHNPSSDTESHEVLNGTPTPTPISSATLPPTPTLTPSPTLTPTLTPIPPTPFPGACTVTPSLLQKSGNTMIMSLKNATGISLEVKTVFLRWNHDKGHQIGSDKTLKLSSISVAGTTVWTGNNPGPSTVPSIIPVPAVSIPNGTSTVVFTFHQSFDNWDGTELVEIYLLNPTCALPISQTKHQ